MVLKCLAPFLCQSSPCRSAREWGEERRGGLRVAPLRHFQSTPPKKAQVTLLSQQAHLIFIQRFSLAAYYRLRILWLFEYVNAAWSGDGMSGLVCTRWRAVLREVRTTVFKRGGVAPLHVTPPSSQVLTTHCPSPPETVRLLMVVLLTSLNWT